MTASSQAAVLVLASTRGPPVSVGRSKRGCKRTRQADQQALHGTVRRGDDSWQFTGPQPLALPRYSKGRSSGEDAVMCDGRDLVRALLGVAAAWLVAGCAGAPPRAADPARPMIEPAATPPVIVSGPSVEDAFARRIVDEARGFLGAPYRLGGAEPAGMDCSEIGRA